MTTDQKLKLFAEGLKEHQERQVELFIMTGRVLAVVLVLSLIIYALHYYKVPQKIVSVFSWVFSRKTSNKIEKG